MALLNELRQGLSYVMESQSGPVHAPLFTISVEVGSSPPCPQLSLFRHCSLLISFPEVPLLGRDQHHATAATAVLDLPEHSILAQYHKSCANGAEEEQEEVHCQVTCSE